MSAVNIDNLTAGSLVMAYEYESPLLKPSADRDPAESYPAYEQFMSPNGSLTHCQLNAKISNNTTNCL